MAGYGNLTGYEPAETPGAYRFLHKDGRKLLAFGPEAEALKTKLDAVNATMPQKTASYTPGEPLESRADAPPMSVSDIASPNPSAAPPGGMSVPPEPNMSVAPAAPPMSPNPGKPPPDLTGYGPTVEAAGPAPPPSWIPYQTAPNGDTIYLRPGGDPKNPFDLVVGSKARSGSRGGVRLTNQSVRGGHPIDDAYVTEQDYAHGSEQAAQQLGTEAADSTAVAEEAYNQRMLANRANAEAEAKAHTDAITGRVQELDNRYERLNKEYNSSKIDPGRMFAGGKNWMYGIAAGLGAIGAALTKSPNYALQVIQQRVGDDIKAQEAEVAVKRDAADNAYKRLLQETGSSELAKKALEGIQLSKLRAEFEVQAKDGRDKTRQARAIGMLAELDKTYSQKMAEYRQTALGEVTKQFVNMPGSAGRAGGQRPLTAAEYGGVAATVPKDAAGAGGKVSNMRAKQLSELDSAEASVRRLQQTDNSAGNPYVVRTGIGASDASQSIGAQVDALAPGLGRALEGNAPNESTMQNIKDGMMSASPAKRQQAYEAYLNQLGDRRRAIEAAPDVAAPEFADPERSRE